MDPIGETGSVRETHAKGSVEWKIPDFFSLSGDVHSYYASPVFCLSDSCWRLLICPKGTKEAPEWLGVYVERQDSGPPKSVEFSFGIQRADGMKEGSKSDTVKDMCKNLAAGWDKVVLISDLQNRRSEFAPSDVLTVTCSLADHSPYPTEVALTTRLWNLSRDLKMMLDEEEETDFTLELKEGCELRAHRRILHARCGYFAGMLANYFEENASGVADIDDIEEGVFQCILSYLYTGEAEGMADQNVCKIYVAADKLLLEELKKLCVYYMKENMSQDLIFDVIRIAETYDESKLKESTLDYFNEHAEDIFNNDGWIKFSTENSLLVAKFLEKIVFRRKK